MFLFLNDLAPLVGQRALLLAETGAAGINGLDQISCCRRMARALVNLCKSATVFCFFDICSCMAKSPCYYVVGGFC